VSYYAKHQKFEHVTDGDGAITVTLPALIQYIETFEYMICRDAKVLSLIDRKAVRQQ